MKTNFDPVIEAARECGMELTAMTIQQEVVSFEFMPIGRIRKYETMAEAIARKISREGADSVRAFVESAIAEAFQASESLGPRLVIDQDGRVVEKTRTENPEKPVQQK